MSIYKIQQFHLNTVDFWAKTLLFRTHQARNSMTWLTLTCNSFFIDSNLCRSFNYLFYRIKVSHPNIKMIFFPFWHILLLLEFFDSVLKFLTNVTFIVSFILMKFLVAALNISTTFWKFLLTACALINFWSCFCRLFSFMNWI